MQFNLRKPCPHCPFRSDGHPYLHPARAQDIADKLKSGNWFGCHLSTEAVEDKETGECDLQCTDATDHCAGAMIVLEKIGRPSQAMQLSERLRYPKNGYYDRTKLDMEAPVFDTLEDFVTFHARSRAR